MLWVKSLHIIFMVTWFAGLFYLPRLYVYHAMAEDQVSKDRFKIMERKLFYGIMTPGFILTAVFGFWVMWGYQDQFVAGGWLHIKLLCVALLVVYHILCGKYLIDFKHDRNTKSHVFYRWFNEFPVILLFVIIFLVELKPLSA
ncbi:MAG: protoporphyrinogen oxidase HemJ [Pseudomonadota bacterium]